MWARERELDDDGRKKSHFETHSAEIGECSRVSFKWTGSFVLPVSPLSAETQKDSFVAKKRERMMVQLSLGASAHTPRDNGRATGSVSGRSHEGMYMCGARDSLEIHFVSNCFRFVLGLALRYT